MVMNGFTVITCILCVETNMIVSGWTVDAYSEWNCLGVSTPGKSYPNACYSERRYTACSSTASGKLSSSSTFLCFETTVT